MGGVLFNFYMSLILQDTIKVTNEEPALLSGEEEELELFYGLNPTQNDQDIFIW